MERNQNVFIKFNVSCNNESTELYQLFLVSTELKRGYADKENLCFQAKMTSYFFHYFIRGSPTELLHFKSAVIFPAMS